MLKSYFSKILLKTVEIPQKMSFQEIIIFIIIIIIIIISIIIIITTVIAIAHSSLLTKNISHNLN